MLLLLLVDVCEMYIWLLRTLDHCKLFVQKLVMHGSPETYFFSFDHYKTLFHKDNLVEIGELEG